MKKIYNQTYVAKRAGINLSWLIHLVKRSKLSEETSPGYIDASGIPYWDEDKAQLLIERLKRNKELHPRVKRIY